MRYLIIAAACLFAASAHAQSGNISGKIADSTGKKMLPLTTITIFKAKDTTIITYRLTTESGEFKVPGLPFDVPLRLMATYSGYEAYRKDFVVTAAQPTVDFGTLKLTGTSKQLDEVIVYAERPPVIFKKDTIEFNASAFKTLPNALLEDMMKKMPGIQVDANGDITYNGRKANRILVDSKRFFGDDPKMATRNLPANIVDKVQVVDDKDEIAQNNDGDMSKIGVVINFTLKKGVKKGWFGKLYAGAGTDERYEGGGIANIYRDTLQVSLIGFSNNVNRSGFSFKDITSLGGFDRSGVNSMSLSTGGGREGVGVNGINFGGMGNGISTTSGAGFNLNHAPNKNLSFYGQYFYGRSRNDVEQVTNTLRFLGDTTINTRMNQESVGIGNSHTASLGGNWRPDTLTNMGFKFNYTHSDNDLNAPTTLGIDNNKLGPLSNAAGILRSNAQYDMFNQNFNISYRFKGKRSRNLSIYESLEHATNPNYNTTESLNQYYYPVVNNQPFNQLRATKSPSTSFYLTQSYSDAFSPKLTFRINNRITYRKDEQDVFTYGKYTSTNKYDSLNYTLSNSLQREQTIWNSTLGFSYKISKIVTFNFAANWLQQWINNSFGVGTSANSKQYYSNLLPSASINWRRNNLSFYQDVSAPSVRSMTPIPDNSNPFNIIYGNPDLQPTKTTGLNFNSTIYNVKSNLSINTYASASIADNATVTNVVLNSNGVQTNKPVNVNGAFNSYISFRVSRQYKNSQKFIVTADMSLYGSYNRAPIFFNNVQSWATDLRFGPNVGLAMNWHDVVEFNPRYNPSFSRYEYSNKAFNNTDVVTHNISGEFIVRVPKKIIWETNMSYRYNSQVSPGLPKENIYWYAAVSMLMLKDDKGQLKFSVYDILNRNNSYYRYINANSITDSRSNVLQRYFSLSFVYNVRAFGAAKAKVGGKQNNMFFF